MSLYLLLILVAVVLLAVVGVVIALLINPKTRWWTVAGILLLFMPVVICGGLLVPIRYMETPSPPEVSQPYPSQNHQQTQGNPAADCFVGDDYESLYEGFSNPPKSTALKKKKSKDDIPTPDKLEKTENMSDAQVGGLVKKMAKAIASELPKEEDRRLAIRALWTLIEQAAEYQKQADNAKSANGSVATDKDGNQSATGSTGAENDADKADTSVSSVLVIRKESKGHKKQPSKTTALLVSNAPIQNRPDWVDAPPGKVGDVYQMTVTVGPYSTRDELDQFMPNELRGAQAEYVERYLGSQAKYRVWLPSGTMSNRVVKKTWEEDRDTSVGPMKQRYVLLEFDRKTNDLLKQRWHDVRTESRIWQAGLALAGVLLVLLIAYGVLKLSAAGGVRLRPLVIWGLVIGIPVVLLGFFFMATVLWMYRCSDFEMQEEMSRAHSVAELHRMGEAFRNDSRYLPETKPEDSATAPYGGAASVTGGVATKTKSEDSATAPYEVAVAPHEVDEVDEVDEVAVPTVITVTEPSLRWSLFVLFPLACGLIALVVFKKTRVFGLILMTVLALGALVMIS